MPMEQGQSQDDDLERTAKLPILEGVSFDFDFDDEEDAVKLDSPGYSGNLVKSGNSGNFGDRGGRGPVALGSVPGEISKHSPLDLPSLADSLGDRGPVALSAVRGEFSKHSPVDLPSLAESMRSVEARIASQHADYEALHRSYERAQGAESAAAARADALERELASARTALEGELSSARAALELEQLRSLRLHQSLAETSSAVELGRSTTEAALREAERHRAESRTLRDSLAARDATVVQVLHSLGERDAQLAALKTEHAKLLPTLDARARSASQLEGELNATRSRLSALGAQLKTEQEMAAALKMELRRSDAEVKTLRADVSAAAMQTARYLEQLRTREWRRGFDQNLLREPDGQIGPADLGSEALKSERDRLQQQLSDCEEKTAALRAEIAARDRTLNEAHAATEAQALRVSAVTVSLEQVKSQHAARIAEYEAAAKTHEEELNVLIVHLQEARRPVEAIVGDVRRLKDELLAKDAAYDSLAEQLRESRAELERTRGALQEREFLIRRLERSETNNATALGRIQNSMERLGSVVGRPVAPTAVLPPTTPDLANSAASPTAVLPIVPPTSSATVAAPSTPPNTVLSPDAQLWPAQLIRIDGDSPIAHALGRRTRIGRAPSCELQIDAASVSRHHALIVLSANEAIIEDLNSTNGVLVNGRKVTRQAVKDGDLVTIGDVPFKFAWRSVPIG